MKRSPFTLVEVLVAMAVFIVGVAPLLGVLTAMTSNHIDYINETKAGKFFQFKIAELTRTGEKISNSLHDQTQIAEYGDTAYYSLMIEDINEGLQQVRILYGTSANLNPNGANKKFTGIDDGRIIDDISFLNVYTKQ